MDLGKTTIKVFGINRSVKTHDKLLKTEREWVQDTGYERDTNKKIKKMRSRAALLAEERMEIDEIFEKYNKDRAKKYKNRKKRRRKSQNSISTLVRPSRYEYIPSSNYNDMVETSKHRRRKKLDQLDQIENMLLPQIKPPNLTQYAQPTEEVVLDEVDAVVMSRNEVKEIARSVKHGSKKTKMYKKMVKDKIRKEKEAKKGIKWHRKELTAFMKNLKNSSKK